jgi:transcriptional regulator with XRE-family HTH domain
MSERETFGPRLRSERERRGISLDTIATVTKVGVDLWEGLERNDFSRWPSGIFARAFVRDYAKAVGLDSDEIVNDFCRLFPIGDRRANRIIKAQAELIGHDPTVLEMSPVMLPPEGERRAAARERRSEIRANRFRFAPRTVAAAIDLVAAISVAAWGPMLFGATFWSSAGVTALLYYSVSTILLGATPGSKSVEVLQQRMPTLFAAQDRQATA